MSEPWSFEDGPAAAERIKQEYADRLLRTLPRLPEATYGTRDVLKGYRCLTKSVIKAARRQQRTGPPRSAKKQAKLLEDAGVVRAIWGIVHRYLVACELTVVRGGWGDDLNERELVLLAEQRVEKLVADVGERL